MTIKARIPTGTSAAKLALASRQLRAETPDAELLLNEPLAVIGMACRFPGGAHSLEAYWSLLINGVDAIVEVPRERWDIESYFDADPDVPGKMNTRWGGFLQQPVDLFDPQFFGIAPREAASMDPQQRLLLEVSWEALEDAGLSQERLAGSPTGVFFSIYGPDYGQQLNSEREAIDAYTALGTAPCVAAGRLSFLLDLQGPSLVVDTACSSSLVAIHLACQSLRAGECRVAVAGASSLTLTPDRNICLTKWRFMAPDGRCKAFDASADGWVRGEGAGAVILKRLADALADGDRVLAVVRGSAVNQDGRSSVLTAPNGMAQQAVVRAALKSGRVAPEEITFVEAHGTGTSIGDPIELEALAEVLGQPGDGPPCVIGAVKSNLGHLEAAAGIAGFIKTVLALRKELIPANLHFKTLNPLVSLEGTRLKVSTANTPWRAGTVRRLAGVSSFGFSGTNAHVVLEEAPPVPPSAPEPTDGRLYVLPISARRPEALATIASAYAALVRDEGPGSARLLDICYTASARRTHHDYRLVVNGTSRHQIAEGLDAFVRSESRWDVVNGRRHFSRRPSPVFVFSGQGPQWWGMGRELVEHEAVFRGTVEQIDGLLRTHASWSLLDELQTDEAASRLHQTEVAQPAIFALQVGLAALLKSWGIQPAAVVGHSVGEIAAAYVAGVLDLEAATRIVYHRGRLMQQATGLGRMAAAGLSVEEAQQVVDAYDGRVSIAAINAPRSVTLSGDPEAVAAIVASLNARQIFCRMLPVDYAFHSRQMAPCAAQLAEALGELRSDTPHVAIVSSVTGRFGTGGDYDALYWARNVRDPVQFWPAIATLADAGHTAFLELAPHPVLGSSLREGLAGQAEEPIVAATLQRGRPERASIRAAIATLYAGGCVVDWSRLLPAGGRVVSLPTYPWQRQRYWAEVGDYRPGGPRRLQPADAGAVPLPGRRLRSPALNAVVFEASVSAASPAFVADHRIHDTVLFPAAAFLMMAQSGAERAMPSGTVQLEGVSILEPLALDGVTPRTIQVIVEGEGDRRSFRVVSLEDEAQNQWKAHVTGTALSAALQPTSPLESVDEIRARCVEVYDRDQWYSELETNGFDFGPAFRTVTALGRRDGEAFAEVELPRLLESDGYALHPATLDGCLQPLWAALPEAIRRGANMDAYVPVGAGAVRVHRESVSRLFSHVTVEAGQNGRETYTGRVRGYTRTGELVLEIDDVVVKRASRASLLRATQRPARDWTYDLTWVETPASARGAQAPASAGSWVVLADSHGVSDAIRQALTGDGTRVVVLGRDETDYGRAIAEARQAGHLRAVIDCRPLDERHAPASADDLSRTQQRILGGLLDLVQVMAVAACSPSEGLVVLTQGAHAVQGDMDRVGLVQAPVWGMARALAIEHPELQLRCIDLDPSENEESLGIVTREVVDAADGEPQVAIRRGVRYAARLARITASASPAAAAGPMQLEITRRGTLEKLAWQPVARRTPGAGEVEVAVEAAGLNFRDVLNALDMYPGDAGALGSECAGIVSGVGSGVEGLSAGDRVVALAQGCFASFATAPAQLVAKLPDDLGMAAAATLPIAFMTARYALEHLADMRAGDRVLVHAAAGGVGLAAVQLAKRAGAEVYATAGSPEKHAFLRALGVQHVMSSRSLDFADEVHRATDGRGVDIVLNSLAGEFIPRSLSALAPRGRFIEIGKTGIWSAERVAAAHPDVAYHVLYLGEVIDRDPKLGRALLESVLADVARGELQPLAHRTFSLNDAVPAFRFMAQARHIGKIVLTIPSNRNDRGQAIRSDGTYLITGGLGALGLAVAEELAKAGARYLLLAGRSAPSASSDTRISRLRAGGVDVTVAAADVAQQDDVNRLIGGIPVERPLRGIVHAAGVLDDGVAVQQSWARFERVLAPKMVGAWRLHEATRMLPLDFFVMFSSVASVLGSAGQANYAAANSFMDALAHVRCAEGLPATSINWGAWADGGMAASLRESDRRRWAAQGVETIEPAEGVRVLLDLVGTRRPQTVVMPISWRRYGESLGDRGAPRLVSDLVRSASERSGSATGAAAAIPALPSRLAAAPPARRMPLLIGFVAEQAIKVLGLPASYALDPHQGLRDVGLDSLMAIEMRNRLQEAVGAPLPATLAFDFPTVAALAAHLASMFESAGAEPTPDTSADDRSVVEMERLSDSEAEELLRKELALLDGRGNQRN